MILFQLNMVKGSLQDELNHFFQAYKNSLTPLQEVSKAAYSKARKKISPQVYVQLQDDLNSFTEKNYDLKRWEGFRLLAIDGTKLQLPESEELLEYFGFQTNQHSKVPPMALASQSFDVLNKLSIDAQIAPYTTSERDLASQHIQKGQRNDLFLFDRGYQSYWLFRQVLSQESQFCARVIPNWNNITKEFVKSGLQEDWVTCFPDEIHPKEEELQISHEPISLRMLRIELDSGEIEILVTSLLDKNKFPYSLFKELYFLRWPVEEDYKTIKHRLQIENFSGKSVIAIQQDFHSKIFIKNFSVLFSLPAEELIKEKTKKRKHLYQRNFTQIFSQMKDTLVKLFVAGDKKKTKIIQDLTMLFSKAMEPVRKERHYDRIKKKTDRTCYNICYKPLR